MFIIFFLNSNAQEEEKIQKQTGDLFESYMKKGLSKSRTNTDSITYKEAYNKLKKEYALLNQSDSYKKHDSLQRIFISKLNITSKNFSEIKKSKSIMEWVNNNIERTEFESLKEAEEFNEVILKADLVHYQENQSYYVLMFELYDKFGQSLISEVMLDYLYVNFD